MNLRRVNFVVLDQIEPRFWKDVAQKEIFANKLIDQSDMGFVHDQELCNLTKNLSGRIPKKLLRSELTAFGQVTKVLELFLHYLKHFILLRTLCVTGDKNYLEQPLDHVDGDFFSAELSDGPV